MSARRGWRKAVPVSLLGWKSNASTAQCRQSNALTRRLTLVAQEIENQRADWLRLFLLDPMPGAANQVTAEHLGTACPLHALETTWALIGPPVAFTGDKHRR